jgi:hypothetical protein
MSEFYNIFEWAAPIPAMRPEGSVIRAKTPAWRIPELQRPGTGVTLSRADFLPMTGPATNQYGECCSIYSVVRNVNALYTFVPGGRDGVM